MLKLLSVDYFKLFKREQPVRLPVLKT